MGCAIRPTKSAESKGTDVRNVFITFTNQKGKFMATRGRKPTVNKSKAIRDYKIANPDAKPREIADYLASQGYDVSPQYVSTILSNERRKTGLTDGGMLLLGSSKFSVDDMYLAKQLVAKTGSVKAAKQAVDCFNKLLV